jgi:hypothetical protein
MLMFKRKPTILDLMEITGFTLILFSIPTGILYAFLIRYGIPCDWGWAMVNGGTMTVIMGILGAWLLLVGRVFNKRHWRRKDKTS